MSDNLFYQTQYVLDKAYYLECFEQSASNHQNWPAYRKAMILTAIGALLVLFTDILPYGAWFIFVLGIIEALSVKYKKAWWITRQMWSQAANNTVHLTIDDRGFTTTLTGKKQHISWKEVDKVTQTSKGWLLFTPKGQHYLSSQCLSPEVNAVLSAKVSDSLKVER